MSALYNLMVYEKHMPPKNENNANRDSGISLNCNGSDSTDLKIDIENDNQCNADDKNLSRSSVSSQISLTNFKSQKKTSKEELISTIAALKVRLINEIQNRQKQMKLITEQERRTYEWLMEKDQKVELLTIEKQELELQCGNLKEQLDLKTEQLNNSQACLNQLQLQNEKSKQIIAHLNQNIEVLKNSFAKHGECVLQKHNQFIQLKEHAMEKMRFANFQLNLRDKKYTVETSKLQAALDKAKWKAHYFSIQLEHKNQEITKLTSVCDGLIEKLTSVQNTPFENLSIDDLM